MPSSPHSAPARTRRPSPRNGPDPGPASPDAAAAFHEILSELVRLYQFRDRQRVCYVDLSVTQCHTLEAIVRKGPLRLDGLAAELALDKSTASRVVDAMEGMGYLERGADASDGRAVRIRATRRGRLLHRRIEGDLLRETRRILGEYPDGAVRTTTRILEAFTAATRRRFAAAGLTCSLPGEAGEDGDPSRG